MKKIISILCFSFFFFMVENVSAEIKHTVKSGDTLWEIAEKYKINLDLLIKSNAHIQNPNLIYPLQMIIIPSKSFKLVEKQRMNITEKKLFDLINKYRAETGLSRLTEEQSLVDAARLKVKDMKKRGYISHISPTYGKPNLMLKELGISFQTVNECIGAGHSSSEELVSSWLSSSVNRAIILNDQATHIGIGYHKGGIHGHYWTILVIKK